jgi:hypothetical protein
VPVASHYARDIFATEPGYQLSRDQSLRKDTELSDDIRLVSFMEYDLGYFDLETRVLEPLENPFGPKVLPMS